MFVLWECEKADYSDSVGRYRYDEPERPGRNHQLFAWAKPENVHETALDVFMAAIQLLKDGGYCLRYLPPCDVSMDSLYLAGNNRNILRLIPAIKRDKGTRDRLVITPPKPEQTEMEKWKASMPELPDYLRKKETDSFSEALLSYDGCMARYGVAMKKWVREMPDA